jgi:hypothetical protein
VGNSVPILKHSHIKYGSNKRIVGSSWSFTILNLNCVGTTANSCISGSRNFIIFIYFIHLRRKLNSLQRYDIAQNYRILHRVVQRIPTKPQNFAPSSYLKTASNKTMIQIMSMIFYYTKVHFSKYNGSWVISTKQTMNFNIQTAAMFVFFCFWQKWSCYKLFILWRSIRKQNFMFPRWLVQVFVHLRSLNVRHFVIVEGTGLKSTASRSPSMAWPSYWIL